MGGSFFEGKPERSRSRARDITPAEFVSLRQPVADTLRFLLTGGPEFTGPFVAPLAQQEIDLLASLEGTERTPAEQAGQETLTRTARGDFLRPGSNPFLQDAIRSAQRPLVEAFSEDARALRGGFTAAGQRIQDSSPFARAEAIRERALANALADVSTQLTATNFFNERQLQQRASEIAGQVRSGEVQRLIAQLQAQALPRLIEQLGIDRGLEEFRRRAAVIENAAALGVGATSATPVTETKARGREESGLDILLRTVFNVKALEEGGGFTPQGGSGEATGSPFSLGDLLGLFGG